MFMALCCWLLVISMQFWVLSLFVSAAMVDFSGNKSNFIYS
jgi:hypothetical protein